MQIKGSKYTIFGAHQARKKYITSSPLSVSPPALKEKRKTLSQSSLSLFHSLSLSAIRIFLSLNLFKNILISF
jgi:hypothetical protein